jgi:hypothetical protein
VRLSSRRRLVFWTHLIPAAARSKKVSLRLWSGGHALPNLGLHIVTPRRAAFTRLILDRPRTSRAEWLAIGKALLAGPRSAKLKYAAYRGRRTAYRDVAGKMSLPPLPPEPTVTIVTPSFNQAPFWNARSNLCSFRIIRTSSTS